jgi:hypothetical protein
MWEFLGIQEFDVTVTDWLIAVCSFYWAWRTWSSKRLGLPVSQHPRLQQQLWAALFFFVGMASLTGGTYHGFFASEPSDFQWLWPMTLMSILSAAAVIWNLAGQLLNTIRAQKTLAQVSLVFLFFQANYVLLVDASFVVAILAYAPALLLLTVLVAIKVFRDNARGLRPALLGLSLSLLAPLVQQAKISLHPYFFTHNSVYHLIQLIALFFIYRSVMNGSCQNEALEPSHL